MLRVLGAGVGWGSVGLGVSRARYWWDWAGMRAGDVRGAGEWSWAWWAMLLKLGVTGRALGGPAERGRPVGSGFERAGRREGGWVGAAGGGRAVSPAGWGRWQRWGGGCEG